MTRSRSTLRWAVLRVASAVVVVYLLLVGWFWLRQDWYVFVPSRTAETVPAISLPYEAVALRTPDGLTLHGWWVPARESRATVLYLHGSGGNITNLAPFLERWNEYGYDALVFDYRGFGWSEGGTPTEAQAYLDGETAWKWLTETRGIPAERIVVWGHSLGGGVASWLAEKHSPRALVLESTFTSVPSVATTRYWWLPVHTLLRSRFDSERRLRSINCPVVVAHSRDDEVIPYRFGEQLFSKAQDPSRFIELAGGHVGGFVVTRGTMEQLGEFLAQNGLPETRSAP